MEFVVDWLDYILIVCLGELGCEKVFIIDVKDFMEMI